MGVKVAKYRNTADGARITYPMGDKKAAFSRAAFLFLP
jgi:hypothetical protein